MDFSEKLHAVNRFAVSESGVIGITCSERPLLSMIYPGTDKSRTVLSEDKIYRSATFVQISNREYLAASCSEDGCLYLWDTESKMSKRVFDPNLSQDKRFKYMSIFKIDDNTIGYGEASASSGRSRRVFILETGVEDWTLVETLTFCTPKNIWDICYRKMADGTPCLLLCIPYDYSIMAVEMIGGRTRWEVSKQQMGEKFNPWNICTDDDTIYVANLIQNMIHLLSAEDGSVITCIDVHQYGIVNPFTVRVHDQHLHVEYFKIPGDKTTVSRFKKKKKKLNLKLCSLVISKEYALMKFYKYQRILLNIFTVLIQYNSI